MARPIIDKAEVSIDFPDKFYMGAFARESRFDVTADPDGVHLWLERSGEEARKVGFHMHYYLLADMLEATASAISDLDDLSDNHRRDLHKAAERLASAFAGPDEAPAAGKD